MIWKGSNMPLAIHLMIKMIIEDVQFGCINILLLEVLSHFIEASFFKPINRDILLGLLEITPSNNW